MLTKDKLCQILLDWNNILLSGRILSEALWPFTNYYLIDKKHCNLFPLKIIAMYRYSCRRQSLHRQSQAQTTKWEFDWHFWRGTHIWFFKKKGIKFLFNFPCGEAYFPKGGFEKAKKKKSSGSQEENGDHIITTHLCRAMVLILEHKQQVGKIKQQGCGKRDPIKVSWQRV